MQEELIAKDSPYNKTNCRHWHDDPTSEEKYDCIQCVHFIKRDLYEGVNNGKTENR